MDFNFLVLDAVAVGGHLDLPDHLVGDALLNLHLDGPLGLNHPLNYTFNLNSFNLFLVLHDGFLHHDFNWLLHLLYHDYWHWDFYDLKHGHLLYHYLLDDFGHFHHFLHYPRHHYNLLDHLFDFDHPGHFHHLFDNAFYHLPLHLHHLFLDYHRNWLLDLDGLNYFLPHWHQFHSFHFQLLDLVTEVRHGHFGHHWHLFGDVKGHHFFHFLRLGGQDLLDDGFVHEHLHLSHGFDGVALDEV